jgi:hypothetical protein
VVRDPVTFVPLVLPKRGIQVSALNAVLSSDSKWLLVSYCFGEDWRAQICYAPLAKTGLPETFVELENFDSRSAITELGCSSFADSANGRLSYQLRRLEDGAEVCSESLMCVSLRHSGKNLKPSSEPILLEKIEFQMKNWGLFGVGDRNHFWLEGQNAFISVRGLQTSSLVKTNAGINVDGDRFRELRPLLQGPVGNRSVSRRICSNFCDGTTMNFLESPIRIEEMAPSAWDSAIDSYRTNPGLLVSLKSDGTLKSEEPFPVPAFFRKALITKTHCFFRSAPSGQFFLTAALGMPQDYVQLGFLKDELQLPDSGINFVFEPLLVLPSSRHLLCVRDVGTDFIDKAQKLGIPLSTLGIIELPFKIG